MSFYNRNDKVAFLGVPTVSESATTYTYNRMKNFTSLSISKNAKEYSRQYVDESSERTTVTGYSTSIGYSFDYDDDYAVHTDIVDITDNEKLGSAAIRPILIVDMNSATGSNTLTYTAIKRDFSVVPDSEGDSTDAYTYSGTFRAAGESETVTVTLDSDGETATITS